MSEKRTRKSAVREAKMLFGDGWLLPIMLWLAGGTGAGYFGYTIVGIPGIIYAETTYGAVTAIRLFIKYRGASVDEEAVELVVPLDHEYDDEDD